jgi:hypothetical protein
MLKAQGGKGREPKSVLVSLTWRECAIGLAFHAAVLVAFGVVLIGAGHGVAPIGLLLFLGHAEVWYPPMALGWLGIAILGIAALAPWRFVHASLSVLGLLALAASWILFISQSEVIPITLALSLPFIGVCTARVLHLVTRVGRAKPAV